MKLQTLVVIFAIIIIPISLVLSAYIQSHIDTISLQSQYDIKLSNATYDAIKAFQLNTINNKYSSVSDSKIRDVEASINTFFTSLATNLGVGGYSQRDLKSYIPAIVYTLYDGYYIYSPFVNTESTSYIHSLKPYIYYTCRYVRGNNIDIVINYTLDNYIVIYGMIDGSYVTKSGYLIKIAPDENGQGVYISGNDVYYNGIKIEEESLEETIITIDDTGYNKSSYKYTYDANNNKIYYEPASNRWFMLKSNSEKVYINFQGSTTNDSAKKYYREAKDFTEWIYDKRLDRIMASDAVDEKGESLQDFQGSSYNYNILDTSDDPEKIDSNFNTHRRDIIRRSIQSNLTSAIANYNEGSQAYDMMYSFGMPILSEQEWDKIINNVCVVTFLQGLPIGNKYYNNYCITANNINKEFVNKNAIELVDNNLDGLHHSIDCSQIESSNLTGYLNKDFIIQTVVYDETNKYYYPHENQSCYYCLIDSNFVYNLDEVLNDNINDPIYTQKIKKLFWTTLARERKVSYKMNKYD